ncbi:MAG: type I restriction endonuclease subunit R [Verrucomicrobia bacterium]|nr:type I restriction endonuclease subunit R [Verrucomicrobiota bacterium]
MPNQGTESQFEETTIDRLVALGYRYQYGGDLDRDWREVVNSVWLRNFLQERYSHLPSEALEEALVRATRPEGITPELRNKNFHQLFTRGFEQKYRNAAGVETFEHIYLVDWKDPKTNDFCVVNQLTIRGQNDRRPDILIYLNGFPLVLFELKNPYEEEPSTLGAFNQVQHYKAGISQLFDYNALVVVSDGGVVGNSTDDTPLASGSTLHGMWTGTWEWYAPWKSINGRDIVESSIGAMKTLIEGLFPKERLLDYIRHFIAFEVVNEKIEKKGAKYHQFFGVRFAVEEAVRATRPDGDRKIGVIWHTQGSGKSLSMAYFVAILRHSAAMENPTFVIQVDRTDLDEQLHDQFVAVRSLVGEVQHAESVDELRSLLRGEGGEVIFSTIEKFRLDEKEAVHPVLSTRRNLIVIADEAHRTQYGLTEGFAYQLRRALPNASFIGFTGTPVSFATADTQAVFGQLIHTYDMVQSRKDHSTVPIYYEARLIKLELANENINTDLEEVTEEIGSTIADREKAKWAAMAEAAGTKERIAELAATILDHYQKRTAMLDGKALIVCMTRRNCVRLYDALQKLPGCPEVKIVMTGNLSEDPPEWSQAGHITTKPQRDAIKARMKDVKDPLKIVIVRDMWLTGTDIPCLHTLYVDKPMKGHTLMQAIARVNRIFSNKPGGLIVDFIGIGDQLRDATKKYTQGGGAGEPAPKIDETAKAVFLELLDDVRKMLPGSDNYGHWRTMSNIEFEDMFNQACGDLMETDEQRDGFLTVEGKLNAAFSLVNHLSSCIGFADEIVFYQLLRKQLLKTTSGPSQKDEQKVKAVRQLLDTSIESKGVVDIFQAAGIEKPDISILDERFLNEVPAQKQENMRVKLLAKILSDEIHHREKSNVTRYKTFREMLEDTLRKYHNRAIQAADVIRLLIEIRKDIDCEQQRTKQLNLTSEELAFYDAVSQNVANLYDQQFLCDLVRDVVQSVKRNLKVDWTKPHREDVMAGVRSAVKNVLRRRGVKAEHLEPLTKQVIIQAEAMFRDWPLAA